MLKFKYIIPILSFIVISCDVTSFTEIEDELTKIEEETFQDMIVKVPIFNFDNLEKIDMDFNKLDFSRAVQHKNNNEDLNNDEIYDFIFSTYEKSEKGIPKIKILDFNLNIINEFEFDSLLTHKNINNILYDNYDINNDGRQDFIFSFLGEFLLDNNQRQYVPNITFLYLSNQNNYKIIEIEDRDIKDEFDMAWDYYFVDIDNDGFIDIFPNNTQKLDSYLYFKNNGRDEFTKSFISLNFTPRKIIRYDFDNDGIEENVNFESEDGITVIFKNKIQKFQIEGVKLNSGVYIDNELSFERFSLFDGDNDGDTDLVLSSIYWCETMMCYEHYYFEQKENTFIYRKDFIPNDKRYMGQLKLFVKDLDNDGDVDMYYPFTLKHQEDRFPRYSGQWGRYFWYENTDDGFTINENYKQLEF